MVAPKENLLSLDHQINMERRTFKTQRVSTQKQKTLHLLQYCQEMQDGVMRAQHHNSQLLQQFEEAQGTLREMATLTAAMKATRMEYEKHLMGIPQWRPQLQEHTREKRNLNNPRDRTYSSPDQPLPSQLSYDGSFCPPHIQPSWTMHPRNPYQLQDSSHAPHFSSHPLQLHHQVLPCHNVPDQPWFWTAAVAGIPSGSEAQFCKTEPPAESRLHSQASSALSSYRKSGGSRNSRLAQELDTQPVRLSCSAESSDDTSEASQLNGKKRGKPKHTSDREHRSPDFQDATVVRTGVKVAQSSGSIASPEESRSSPKGEGPNDGPLKVENGVKEREDKKNEDSRSSSEESRCEQTGREESENSGSVNIKMKTGRSGVKNEEVKDDKRLQEEDPEESDEEAKSDENDVRDEEEQERKEKEVSKRSKTTDDTEEDAGAEEEMEEQESEESGGMKDEDSRRLDSASSQEEVDEDKNEVSEDDESDKDKKTQDSSYDEGEMEEVAKEKRGDSAAQGEDESDSDECIISLHKSKMLHIIPEEAPEDEEEEEDKPGNSEEGSDEFSDDDIEDLLAPQQAPKTQEKEMNREQKAKGSYDRMQIFQVETEKGSSPGDHPSDSDEFDHFFD